MYPVLKGFNLISTTGCKESSKTVLLIISDVISIQPQNSTGLKNYLIKSIHTVTTFTTLLYLNNS